MKVSIDYSLLIAVFWDAEDFDDAVRRRRGRLTAHKPFLIQSTSISALSCRRGASVVCLSCDPRRKLRFRQSLSSSFAKTPVHPPQKDEYFATIASRERRMTLTCAPVPLPRRRPP